METDNLLRQACRCLVYTASCIYYKRWTKRKKTISKNSFIKPAFPFRFANSLYSCILVWLIELVKTSSASLYNTSMNTRYFQLVTRAGIIWRVHNVDNAYELAKLESGDHRVCQAYPAAYSYLRRRHPQIDQAMAVDFGTSWNQSNLAGGSW